MTGLVKPNLNQSLGETGDQLDQESLREERGPQAAVHAVDHVIGGLVFGLRMRRTVEVLFKWTAKGIVTESSPFLCRFIISLFKKIKVDNF